MVHHPLMPTLARVKRLPASSNGPGIAMSSTRLLAVVLALAMLLPGNNSSAADTSVEAERGIAPTDASGKPLTLDLETGTRADWTAEGEAFVGQPIEGDTVAARKNMRSRHAGRFWIGGYERLGDGPQGTLTSRPFKVTQPYAR